MRRVWMGLALAGILAVAAFLAIRSGRGPSEPRVHSIRIGYIPIADCAQLFVAVEEGFFDSEDLAVELVSLDGGARILEALGAGSLDIGFSNIVSLILSRAQGLPFKALTGGPVETVDHEEHAILVIKDSPISGLGDLSGRTIALNTRRNIDELMVRRLLSREGVDLSTIRFVEVPFPRMFTVLQGGSADAAAVIEPFVTAALADPLFRAVSYNYVALQERTEVSTYVATDSWISSTPEVVSAFRRAIAQATDFANENPSRVRQILTKYTRLDSVLLSLVKLPFYSDSLSLASLTDMITQVKEMGWIEAPLEADSLVAR